MEKIIQKLSALNNRLMNIYLLVLFIILWQLAPSLGWVNPVFIPAFSTILGEAAEITPPVVLLHVGYSLRRVLTGMLFCIAAALPLGFILGGALPRVAVVLRALMNFLSQIPPYILYAVIAIVAGPGEQAITFVIVWSAFWPVLFTTIQGVSEIDPRLIRCARSMNAGNILVFRKVVLPAVFPNLMRGLRQGMTMGFLMLIGAESMGAQSGIGWLIHNAQVMGYVNRVYLGALLSALIGFLLNFVMGFIEKKLVVWKEVPEHEKAAA
ncbi:MAG: ABC transporter permease [Spirochaetaceae bacterium]|jgi:NitT/TauT family transport system permease protein|nr:ABC transporter permease [Spirochaetaceae bacterium]